MSVIAAIALGGTYGCQKVEQTKQEAIKAGLVEKQNPGSSYVHWTKP